MRFPQNVFLLICVVLFALPVLTQSPNGTINGLVNDSSNSVIPEADIVVVNDATGIKYSAKTSNEGIYILSNLPPGSYRLQVSKIGFKTLIKPDIVLNVQDALAINFTLPVGAFSETVTVEGGAPLVNTESAAVSTVVDRQFAENLPMNGRSFQTLIQLTPGVVVTPSTANDNGQFSVNGQRSSSNYWMVDGVSANIGIGASQYSVGNGLSGSIGSFNTLGGTNSLVSVDALREFRIQTSTFAPEFGRTPGGQISIVTRSGTNQWHGSVFDYLRNDVFDANDWFANHNLLPKPEERQNDFGGTFSGPIFKDRTFFFFSYEGLRLRLPQVVESLVPDLSARQNAAAAVQPFLNAFPRPTPGAQDDPVTQIAQFNASYSNATTLNAYSLRIDHRLGNKLTLFGRYNYSPSETLQRDSSLASDVQQSRIAIQTATAGVTWAISAAAVNDLRFNYSRASSTGHWFSDSFGGAVPLTSLPFPAPFNGANGVLDLITDSLNFSALQLGLSGNNLQRQINLVDNITLQKGSHNLKVGIDFRQLSPIIGNFGYFQEVEFSDVPSFSSGVSSFAAISSGRNGEIHFHNLGMFAQDTWRATPALTITYGLRWDLDFAPSSNPALLSVTGFTLNDLSNLALAPAGTPPFRTTYGNLAPRVGVAYQLAGSQKWQTVLRGGFGLFYDLATSEVGNNIYPLYYPFGATKFCPGGAGCAGAALQFPLDSTTAAPPPITVASVKSIAYGLFDPNLLLPYTFQWNVALEQALGEQQTLSLSYIGSAGRRLMQTGRAGSPNANFAFAFLTANAATSDYDSLQVQFRRRLSRGLQALASYTLSHSIDTASAGSLFGNTSNALTPNVIQGNRGPSDFDVRNALTTGMTYDVPISASGGVAHRIFGNWSIQNVLQARTAPPVTVFDGNFRTLNRDRILLRPDRVADQPLYLYGPQYPGEKAFNPAAFVDPPLDTNGNPIRQGDVGRNALRSFGAWQWDFSVHRDFPVRDSFRLQFRAEMFNVLNHPNFAPPQGDISNTSQFGLSTQTLGAFLSGANAGGSGLNSQYQIGGPRSIQLAMKLIF